MSRLGKKEIFIPKGVEVSLHEGLLKVKGPKGDLEQKFGNSIDINISDKSIKLKGDNLDKDSRTLWGTYWSHVNNMIHGVTEGYQKKLLVEGVGFKVDVQGNKLVMSLGFSHPVEMDIPEDVEVEVNKNEISVSGINKEKVGQFAADIRAKKKPEPYKGKGIRYEDEVIRRKEGKKAVTAA